MNWDDLRLLHYVAQKGSFLKAAQSLGLTAATVSRRISQLEEAISATLVERGVEGTKLTTKGLEYAKMAGSISKLVSNTQKDNTFAEQEFAGNITLTSTFAMYDALTYASSEFLKNHPDCTVDYNVTDKYLDIVRGEADVAIRVGNTGEESLVYKKIGEAGLGFYASKEYLKSIEGQLTPQNVHYIGHLPGFSVVPHQWVAQEAGFTKTRFRTVFGKAKILAIRHGLGVGIISRTEAAGLIEVFREISLPTLNIYLVTRTQALKQPQIRAFVDHLYEYYRQIRSFIKYGNQEVDFDLKKVIGDPYQKTR